MEVEDQELQTPEIDVNQNEELAPSQAEELENNTEEHIEEPGQDVDDDAGAPSEQPVVIDGVEINGPQSFKKAINKQHYRYKEEERKRLALEKEIADMKASLNPQNELQAVEIPPLPDPWAENYEEQILARDKAIEQNVQFKALEAAKAERDAQEMQARQAKQREYVESLEKDFLNNSQSLGLKTETVTESANIVASYGVDPEIANLLMSEKDGPLIVNYLAQNPVELEQLTQLSPVRGAIKLTTDIRAKASQLKPKQTNAPSPTRAPRGGGVSYDQRGPKGATFE